MAQYYFIKDKYAKQLFGEDDEVIHKYIGRLLEKVTNGALKESEFENLKIQNAYVRNNKNTVNSEVDALYGNDKFIINLEYNLYWGQNVINKNFNYLCNIYSRNIKKHDVYVDAPRVIQINFCSYNIFEPKKFIHIFPTFSMKNFAKSPLIIIWIDLSWFKNIEPKDFKKLPYLKKMLYFLYNGDTNLLKSLYEKEDEILMAMVKKCITLDESEDELLYISKEDFERHALEEERQILREEGREEGRKEGLEQGIEQGKEQSMIDFAKNMLKNKFSIDDIVRCTGLSKNKLDSIINS